MFHVGRFRAILTMLFLLMAALLAVSERTPPGNAALPSIPVAGPAADAAASEYVVLSWNDLGMHCYNADFQDLAVLPPFNTLWAQVVRVGDPPQIVTEGISVTYAFPDNTYSVGKSNFWEYDQQLFGVDLPDNVGLTGTGLSGEMEQAADHFVAEGIPLTEFRDSAPTVPYPYQLATVIVHDAGSGAELARSTVVAPVSTEMHCDYCHFDGGVEDIATGRVETNILTLHDEEHADEYPAGHRTALMQRRPVLCAECHASNALGAPGLEDVPNLSRAMHEKHAEHVTSDLEGCYSCHPGPSTQCLRDTMSQAGMDCIDCHGDMSAVARNTTPWLNEPRCDNAACHGSGYQQDAALYRMSKEHGGVYCAACHDSPHAIAPSREANDRIKFVELQGHAGTLNTCTVCHASTPAEGGPHGMTAPSQTAFTFGPDRSALVEPGGQVVYTHTLRNTGTVTDTYGLEWKGYPGDWAEVSAEVGGGTVMLPFTLPSGESAIIEATVTVPDNGTVRGLEHTTVITATSSMSPTLIRRVVDVTYVSRQRICLPLLLKQ